LGVDVLYVQSRKFLTYLLNFSDPFPQTPILLNAALTIGDWDNRKDSARLEHKEGTSFARGIPFDCISTRRGKHLGKGRHLAFYPEFCFHF
jgi:hypothetical protein